MRHDFLDRFSRIDSIVHRTPTFLKVIISVGLIVAIVSYGNFSILFYAAIFISLFLINLLSKIPMSFVARRILLLEPFVVGISVMILFQPDGLKIFLFTLTKSTLSLYVIILLANTTPFTDILNFLKRIYIPGILITILALMYRYVFVLIDEAERMNRARISRTFINSKAQFRKSIVVLIGQLFVRSTERAERIYASMRARGWR